MVGLVVLAWNLVDHVIRLDKRGGESVDQRWPDSQSLVVKLNQH